MIRLSIKTDEKGAVSRPVCLDKDGWTIFSLAVALLTAVRIKEEHKAL